MKVLTRRMLLLKPSPVMLLLTPRRKLLRREPVKSELYKLPRLLGVPRSQLNTYQMSSVSYSTGVDVVETSPSRILLLPDGGG